MRKVIQFALSPTRFFIDYIRGHAGLKVKNWTHIHFYCTLCIVIFLSVRQHYGWTHPHFPTLALYIFLWVVPFSRINELSYAFWADALDSLGSAVTHENRTGLSQRDRLQLLAQSYLEVVMDFGILYFYAPCARFTEGFTNIVQALYFSGVTIATLGDGHISPVGATSRVLCVWELGTGFVLIVFAFGSYISHPDK